MGGESVIVPHVDDVTLTPVLCNALGPDVQLNGPWHGRPLHGGFGGQGLYRFEGKARSRDGERPWTVILKVCPPKGENDDPAAWDAPRREALAYTSGFLDQLRGPLVAPRCLGLTERPDGSAWLWLEEVVDECPGPWGIDRFILTAHHLGRFNGAFLAAGALPDHAWLSRNWLRRYIAAEGVVAATMEVAVDAPPLLRQCFPPPITQRLRELWAERETFLSILDRLPQTVCHHDAFRRNLFARRTGNGQEQTVAIDWAFAGIGAVGAELTPLVVGSLGFFEVRDSAPRELAEAALAGYLEGLREAGWDGDEKLVRLGFFATAALLYTVGTAGLTLAITGDPNQYSAFESAMGRTIGEAVAVWAELSTFEFELAEEARRLSTQLVL
jgi:hypothetical protein